MFTHKEISNIHILESDLYASICLTHLIKYFLFNYVYNYA